MKPVHYQLYLEPDLKSFTFKGRVVIEILADDPADQVVLDAKELVIHSCCADENGAQASCTYLYDLERQEIVVDLPQTIQGCFKLTLDYEGVIAGDYAGFYRSRYTHNGRTKYLASTQFEASDARRAFPCFDHPSQKATFDIELLIDANLTAIANTAVTSEESWPDGKKLVRFERTPIMSTYLVFFAVGKFEFLQDEQGPPLVRVVTTKGKREYGRFALDMGRKSLDFCVDYTGIDYPLSKLDFVAIPDSMGAMENFGAIRHRENELLVIPGVTSEAQRVLNGLIIAHETAHMWFGDLVSPADWNDLWLNESFATYFTYLIPHYFYPDWNLWDRFLVERFLGGMERDSLPGTIPIELPAEQNTIGETGPTPSNAPIVYNKGAAVIRMLAYLVGEDQLQKGIHHFLTRYAFDCANSEQFWDAFAEAVDAPVADFAQSWVYQPGYPLVEARRGGRALFMRQQRFTLGSDVSDALWLIPVDIEWYLETGETEQSRISFSGRTTSVSIPAGMAAYKLNAGQRGFFRVQYEREMLDRLGQMIQERRLSAADTFGVLNDLFALVKRGDYTIADYMDFIQAYCGREDRYLPLLDLIRNLTTLYVVVPDCRQGIGRLGRHLFEPALESIGWGPQPGEGYQTTALREELRWALAFFGSLDVLKWGRAQFHGYLAGQSIAPDTMPSVLKIGALTDGQALGLLTARIVDGRMSESEIIHALGALGCLPDWVELQSALQWNLEAVPANNQAYMLQAAARNPAALEFLWGWLVENLELLQELPPSQFLRIVVSLAPTAGLGRQAEVAGFLSAVQDNSTRESFVMALELLAIYSRLAMEA